MGLPHPPEVDHDAKSAEEGPARRSDGARPHLRLKPGQLIRRFLVPQLAVTAYYALRFRCFISPRAEVELSPLLSIGAWTQIGSFTKVKASAGPLTIGANVSIATGCALLAGEEGLTIGDDCLISPNVVMISRNYRYDRLDGLIREQGVSSKGVTIGRGAWIGAGVVVRDGARIGDGTIVAPNSVVASALPAGTICEGNPARVVFWRR